MKNKKIFIIFLIALLVILFIIFYQKSNNLTDLSSSNKVETIDIEIDKDNGDEDIDWSKYEEKEYSLTKSLEITEGGIYTLTGNIENGLITINTSDDVKLILDNVNIINSEGPAIYVKEANNTVIELVNENYLEDGNTYEGYDADVIGTIFSHDDLIIEGSGTLKIKSNNEDAIVSKDDLKIKSGTFSINSKDDGIRGKDSVYILDGIFDIVANGDGIKSTNDTDETKGFILIENGIFNIESLLDGISAESKLLIETGTFNIKTGGGSANSSSSNEEWGKWGMKEMHPSKTEDTESAKGLKTIDNLVIKGGSFTFDTSDDSIHSNSKIGIISGTFNISSGDDGIHADDELIIDNGNITINKSYEGIEAANIVINNGSISLTSSDDGINVAGGNDSSSFGRPGENSFSDESNYVLTVNDGNIYINASGDGIDVNGFAYINGGNIKIDGPTNSGNGALDYDKVFEVNSGSLLAGGADGMTQSISNSSKYKCLDISFNNIYGSEDIISIEDKEGNVIATYQSDKEYSSLVIANSLLEKGKEYIIKVNEIEYDTITISDNITSHGNTRGENMNPSGMRPEMGMRPKM